MSRFIDELRSAEFEATHPISQAAYAHYAFVCIHPFADGNGRVARALASIYLYCSPGVPLVIFHDQRAKYIDALETADRGQFHSLMRFIADEVTDTVNLINDELSGPVSGSSAGELAALLSEDRFPLTALDAAGRLQEILGEELHTRLEKKAGDLVLSFMVHGAVIGEAPSAPKGYLPINEEMAVTAFVNARSPMEIHTVWPVLICRRSDDSADFDLVAVSASGRSFGVYLREVLPTVSESFRLRVGFFADAVVEEFLRQVADYLKRLNS